MDKAIAIDARLRLASGMIIVGPSQAGKTRWCKHLLESANELFDTPINKFYWYYGIWSAELLDFRKETNMFVRAGIPREPSEIEPNSIVVIDDNIKADLSAIFSTWTHHLPCLAIKITQNLFHKKTDRTTNLCAQYLVIFKYPGDKMIVRTLATQMRKPWLVSAYENSTQKPHSYILIDLHQKTDERIHVRTNILPGEGVITVMN